MKKFIVSLISIALILLTGPAVFGAYHHEGENDSGNFLVAYPDTAGTKLDHCALCHTGGEGPKGNLGSCQYCHYQYGYDGMGPDGTGGNILDTLNVYGLDYRTNGSTQAAIEAIGTDSIDSDGDGFSNKEEIEAVRYPGDPNDDPTKVPAPFRVYTMAQLEALGSHTQFLLMNTSRSGDFYAQYTGVPMEDLLDDAGILSGASKIVVYAPDGWSNGHPLDPVNVEPGSGDYAASYHVNGTYPLSSYTDDIVYHYDEEADDALNLDYGWCDYSAPSCLGRSNGDIINNPNGLKMILAYKREGVDMDAGVLNEDNKLDGEGPFRVVPPQRIPSPPDLSSKDSDHQATAIWPYDNEWDHNAGSSSRTATIIKVEPLPVGTTDISILEAGWDYVDQEKIIIYGAIDGTDSNGNGILDSEEGTDIAKDFDNDGTPDYQDNDTATMRHPNGLETILIHASGVTFENVACLDDSDPSVPQTGKPSTTFPYGTTSFEISGVTPFGASVTVTLVFPDNVPTDAKYYKISSANGWIEIPFGSNDGDNIITIVLTDGDPTTDSDGLADGRIVDPGALATAVSNPSASGGSGGGCFISTLSFNGYLVIIGLLVLFIAVTASILCSNVHRKLSGKDI